MYRGRRQNNLCFCLNKGGVGGLGGVTDLGALFMCPLPWFTRETGVFSNVLPRFRSRFLPFIFAILFWCVIMPTSVFCSCFAIALVRWAWLAVAGTTVIPQPSRSSIWPVKSFRIDKEVICRVFRLVYLQRYNKDRSKQNYFQLFANQLVYPI